MNAKVFIRALKILTLIVVVILNGQYSAIARNTIFVIKAMGYSQSSASAPALQGYMFMSMVGCSGASTVTNAVLTPPGRSPITMHNGGDEFGIQMEYMTQTALDADFPNGTYTIQIQGATYATPISVSLTGNTYPTTPQISNFTAAQSINPNADFTLTWNSLGLTSNDFIQIMINGCDGDTTVFETPAPFEEGALKGNITSFTIPANTLYPGLQYNVEMIAAKIVNVITNSNSDGTKNYIVSGYAKFLQFPIKTTGSASGCIVWDKPNFVFFFPEGTISGTNAQYTTPRTVSSYNMYFQIKDPNPTNSILFTGPFGSGLSNTPSAWSAQGEWTGFSSPILTLFSPNQITGGVYTISYKGISLKFNINNPQVADRQIFLVPQFVVDSQNRLKEIKWSYVRSDGSKVPPQEFMDRVGIIVNATWGGQLFQTFELRPAFTNYVITNTVVNWNDVSTVQIGFTAKAADDYQNFMTIWRRSTAPPQLEISNDSFSGTVGQSFSGMLTASGGMFPYKWSIQYGFLPGGLVLDELSGIIQGTPGEYGSFKVNVRVEDSIGSTASKDIYFLIAPGSFTHKPAFTNLTKIDGLPSVTLLTMPQQFYTLEISEDLKNWRQVFFFTASGAQMPITVPQNDFKAHDKLFFRLALGHKFDAGFRLIFFANAGTINPNSPYTVSVNYPVSISGYHAAFTAQFDPDYAALTQVYFNNPVNRPATQIYGRADQNEPGTIEYVSDFISGIPPTGNYSVNYKGTNLSFNVSHQANSHLVVPLPAFTVNSGILTGISWSYRNPSSGSQYSSTPSFITELNIEIDDVNGNRVYDYHVENLNTTTHTLQKTINWNSIRTIYMAYEDDLNSHFVISFTKN